MPPSASNPRPPLSPRNGAAHDGTAGGDGQAAQAAARDAELFEDARRGDRGAFGKLAIRTQDRLYTAVLRIVGDVDEAKELTQETFVRALAALPEFRGQSGPYTWLYRIGINLALTHLRTVQRRRTFSLDAPRPSSEGGDQAAGLAERLASAEPPPDQVAQKRETKQQVLICLGELDDEQRTLIVLRDIDGMDYQGMSDVLEIPLGTLKSRLFRARLALREKLLAALKA